MRRIVPYDTRTGVPLRAFVDTSAWSFKESITQPGQGSFTVPLQAQAQAYIDRLGVEAGMVEARRVNARLTSGWETTWAVESNPAPAFRERWDVEYAGLVMDWTWSNGSVVIQTLELAKILELRPLWGTHGSTAQTFNLSGQTLGDVIREVLWYAIAANRGSDRWPLPVDVGPLRHGDIERPEWRYHFRAASEIVDELSGEDGAPDWVLRPHKDGDNLRWRLELGDPYLVSEPVRLPVSTSNSRVKSQAVGLSIKHDFQGERTGINILGAGSEVDMRWGTAGTGEVHEARAQIPVLIGIESHKNLDDKAQLDSLARASLRTAAGGVEQWSFSVQTGWEERIKPGMIRAGSTVLLDHPGDALVAPGRRAHYVLSVSSDASMRYQIESQEIA